MFFFCVSISFLFQTFLPLQSLHFRMGLFLLVGRQEMSGTAFVLEMGKGVGMLKLNRPTTCCFS